MLRALEQLSMPSRPDFTALAERVTHIEMLLDDMDAKLDRLIKQSRAEPRHNEEETHLGEESRSQRRSMPVAETSSDPVEALPDSPDLEQGPHPEGGDRPDAQRTGLGAQQGQALPVYAGGADRTTSSGSAAAGFCLDEPAVDHGSSARPQFRRVHGEARLRRLPARLGSAGAGRQAPVVRRLLARVPSARHQEDEGHYRLPRNSASSVGASARSSRRSTRRCGRTRGSAISCSSPRRSISATRNR